MTPRPAPRLGQFEFVAMMAMLAATVASSIDAMLPALGQMGAQLSPEAPERAPLVVAAFVAGMGFGTLFSGPLSDAFGRKTIMLGGLALYAAAALWASASQTLEAVLWARVVQGLGASGPRVVVLAAIRDLYRGTDMARLVSFVMIVFTLVPVLAPTIGAWVMGPFGWRGVFWAFVLFAAIASLWSLTRLPEPLAVEDRRPFRLANLRSGLAEIFSLPMVRLATLVQTLVFGMLFGVLSSTQAIFDVTYGRAESFHLWFGGIALVAGTAGFLNAHVVRRFGMRPIILNMLCVTTLCSFGMSAAWWMTSGQGLFWGFVLWQTVVFFQAGMVIGNLNALALEPLGHLAGLGASFVTGVATLGGAAMAVGFNAIFDGTPLPLVLTCAFCASWGVYLTLRMQALERVKVSSATP